MRDLVTRLLIALLIGVFAQAVTGYADEFVGRDGAAEAKADLEKGRPKLKTFGYPSKFSRTGSPIAKPSSAAADDETSEISRKPILPQMTKALFGSAVCSR